MDPEHWDDSSWRHRHLSVGEISLHVVEAGPADGPVLVLLHGFPEFWGGWRHQIGTLAAAGFRVIVPDQRGYNLSDKPRGLRAYGLDSLVDDLLGLLDAVGSREAMLAGHDWGAAVAWWAAIREPDRIRRLAILNVPHPAVMRRFLRRDRQQRRRSWYIFFFQLPWLPEHWYRRNDWEIAARSLRGTARRGTFSSEDLDRYREAWSRPRALTSMIHWYRAALWHPPRRPRTIQVQAPTLILWGARDRFLSRRMVEPSLELCRQGRAELLPDASHWLHHEEPERVAGSLVDFFSAS